MNRRFSKQSVAALLVAGGVVLMHGAASAANLSVCIDQASATAARDQKLAEAVARREGVQLAVARFDSSGDDDGFSLKDFKKLIGKRCSLVLGYPMDVTDGAAPGDLMVTKPYDHAGFVLVVPASSSAKSLAELPSGSSVAVTYMTAPNLYMLNHRSLLPDVHESDTETLKSLTSGAVKAAMVWGPTLSAYLAATPGAAGLKAYPLDEPHARFNVVALYGPEGAADAARFQMAVADLDSSGGAGKASDAEGGAVTPGGAPPPAAAPSPAPHADSGALPALYTAAQAAAGHAKFIGNCQMCHGSKLQGISGPALKGPNFASAKSAFTVSDVFTIVSQNMPASQPGTLPPNDYVDIMAFLLQQNGYPAGATPLTFAGAGASKVALLWHGS
jgi:mono/diheme cytochrome c family protein